MKIQGVYVLLVTPFINDKVDFYSYKRMINDLCANKVLNAYLKIQNDNTLDKTVRYNH